jgi:hypothetical protein
MTRLSFIAFALLIGCKNGGNSKAVQANTIASTVQIKLPNIPEKVVRTWEEQVNKSDFDAAKQLCTDTALELVNSLSKSNDIEKIEPTPFTFEKVTCREKGNTATCDCILKYEDSGRSFFQYLLINSNGQWLVSRVLPIEAVSMEVWDGAYK